ncbi:HLA class II histocompatibility antigen, DM alpha chain isoform X1 [Artibeus jamaicensis]|uniref:HLA class II histocompatibility antigen, DM alpha chain isoform X1 n=1 Tax=Artibeus jamaicensis TaxID=9417 RepID=UPI00235B0F2C|nr:HLA class II histocompatibility antigen, DM alpha chain isoform X1 [Artibeus jamaicensis]
MARTLLEVSWWNMIWGLSLESWWTTPSQPSVGAVMDHQWQPGPVLLQLLHLLWLLPQSWTAPQGWRDDLLNHTFQHTMYCQKWSPSMGLSETYDNDQLFSFDFSQNTRVPRLPEFADWAQKSEDNSTIFFDKAFCQAMIHDIGPKLEGRIPECRGIPVAEVFTLKPLEFGKPNTLVCFVSNLFPPALTVTWQHHLAPVEGAGPTFVSAIDGLSFQAFSYLNFTPAPSDLFSCVVTHEIDGQTAVAYWVPNNALPSDLLENVLCGVAFGLGVLGIIVGLVLIIYFRKPCSD